MKMSERTAAVKRPESFDRIVIPHFLRNSIASFALATVVGLLSASTQSVFAQSLQSGEGVALNNGIPREVENVTVDQNLGDSVPLNLPLIDFDGAPV